MKDTALPHIEIDTDLNAGDLAYVAYLHGLIYQQECGYGLPFEAYVLESLGDFAHRYDPDRDRAWVCRHDNKIIGFLAAVHRGESMQLRYFLLLKQYRGLGLGKRLMGLFMDHLLRSGLKKAYLWTTDEQLVAAAIYRRFGFRLAAEKPSAAFGKQLTEQRYELSLD